MPLESDRPRWGTKRSFFHENITPPTAPLKVSEGISRRYMENGESDGREKIGGFGSTIETLG